MWRITKDNIDNGIMSSVGRKSRSFDEAKWHNKNLAGEISKFRLLDDDKEVYFYGEYDGLNKDEAWAFSPLDDWGAAFGCTILEYKNESGEWETL
jgi:hypothetical protein